MVKMCMIYTAKYALCQDRGQVTCFKTDDYTSATL